MDATGCPMDSDGDGVCDGIDKCPDTPRGTKVDATGCPIPEPKPQLFQGKPEMVLEGVTFPTDKWQLTAEDKTILDKAVTELKQYPEVKIEVQGHTDSTDGDPWNMTLSQRRAESVMKYMVEQGVPASQLTAKGYGKTQPIADNKTKEGRAQNRRSVLHKVD